MSELCSARLGPRSCTLAPHDSGRHEDAAGTWLGHTPPVLTLADFLLARIAEDARLALAVMSAEDDASAGAAAPYGYGDAAVLSEAEKVHMVRWDPARVLAECDAKRRIVAWHRLIDGLDTEDNPVRGCGNCIASGAEPPYIIAGPCMTVRLLALPYADHPDYRQEWKP